MAAVQAVSSAQVELPVARVAYLHELYPRKAPDPERVGNFAEVLKDNPEAFPPIEVVRHDRQTNVYVITDGVHRWEAHKRAGLATISASILEPPEGADLSRFVYERGLWRCTDSALPLTTKEKVAAVRKLLAMAPELSDNAIGRLLGVSHVTVGKYRAGFSAKPTSRAGKKLDTRVSARTLARALQALSDGSPTNAHAMGLLEDAFSYYGDEAKGWWRYLGDLVALSGAYTEGGGD